MQIQCPYDWSRKIELENSLCPLGKDCDGAMCLGDCSYCYREGNIVKD